MRIGHIDALFRYPVKSMAGEPLESATSRLARHSRAIGAWLFGEWATTAECPGSPPAAFPSSCSMSPLGVKTALRKTSPPTYAHPMAGAPAFSEELAADVERCYGSPVQMIHFRNGIFDETNLSVIASETMSEIGRLAGFHLDVRRFRPNVVVRFQQPAAFPGGPVGRRHALIQRRRRRSCDCRNDARYPLLDGQPRSDSARPAPEVMKAVVREHQNTAGVYGTVTRIGRLEVGQPIFLTANS